MTSRPLPETLTVLFDGGCPLCRREIAHVQGLAQRQGNSTLCFVDVNREDANTTHAVDRAALLARFHVQRADGTRLHGAAAFVEMWARLPGWRWLARLARLPGMMALLEAAYSGFLRLRPALQAVARFLEPAPELAPELAPKSTSSLSLHMERELRSDHAGETGAVSIYRGIASIAAWRGDVELLAFARRHGDTEAEHLKLVEARLPAHRRSRLLGPWRLAGWLTGALPALAGRRAVYATIAAVETFVEHHYQQQIDHLQRHGGPDGLLPLLQRCQADERHHRQEAEQAAAQAGAGLPWPVRLWCAMVGAGSAAAVVLARRV